MIARRQKRPDRRGAAMVEAVLIITVFLTLCLGVIDLGIAVFQNNAIAEASRQSARLASVHGAYAADDGSGTVWGPTTDTFVGSSTTDPIAIAIRGSGALAGLNPANVLITVSWPTGNNSVANGDTVAVTVRLTWTPITTYVIGAFSTTLFAESIMPIAH